MSTNTPADKSGSGTPDKLNYLIQANINVVENVKLADQKATVLVAVNTALLGGLFSAKLLALDSGKPWWLAALSLGTGAFLAGGVVLEPISKAG